MRQLPDLIHQMLTYEQGKMTHQQVVAFFQHLIDTGAIAHLQGHYRRSAQRLIAAGHCRPRQEPPSVGK